MSKQRLVLFFMLSVFLFPVKSFAEEVPHPSLNIPHLCTFGKASGTDWGDDDFSQTLFFKIPETLTDTLFIRIFDPDTGGRIDEIQGIWDTKTRFQLYGGIGAYTSPDAKAVNPQGDYKSGRLLAEETYAANRRTDGKWIRFAEVLPKQGELVDGHYIFKLIIEGIEGNDGNLYKLDISTSASKNLEDFRNLQGLEIFAYEWTFRLPNAAGEMVYTFPFIIPKNTKGVISNIWDFDNDNKIYMNTPSRPGLPVYATGKNEWAITKYDFSTEGSRQQIKEMQRRWSATAYDILDEDFKAPWTFQIHKGRFLDNDMSLYVTDTEGNPFPMYSSEQPRSGMSVRMNGKVHEPELFTTEKIALVKRNTPVNTDITLSTGSVLPRGTTIAKPTRISQDIPGRSGKSISADTVLENDVILEKKLVLRHKMVLKKNSVLVKNTRIAKGSLVFEGLAPAPGILPPCNTVLLDASSSKDPDGNPLTFVWDMGDGTQAEGEKIIHTFRKPGTYVVSMTATDDSGAINDTASKAMTIVINAPPVANAGDNRWACTGESVRFDASESYDPDGTALTYQWDFGDGASATGAVVSHAYKHTGTYPVTLEVTDSEKNGCNTDTDGIVIIVNQPPIANAGKYISGCDYAIQFDGTKSFDPDGNITKYLWYFGDGSAAVGPTPEHTYIQPGKYRVKLLVSDDSDATCNTALSEMEVSINAFPVAEAGADRRVCINEQVYFDGTASSDPDNDQLAYLWDFGDQTPPGKISSPVHIYKAPGKYTVSLTVTDDSNTSCASHTDTATVSVDTYPVADAGANQLADEGQTITFDGSGSTDPNGYPLSYNWTFGDLSEPADGENPTHIYNKPGIYKVLLTVSNMANPPCSTDTDEMTVTVNHPPTARAKTECKVFLHDAFVIHAGGEIIFDGSASFDPDGTIIEYQWDFGDQTPMFTSPNPKARHAYVSPGRYTVTLTVKDSSGLPKGIDTDTVDVIVNAPPEADAGNPGTMCMGQVMFDGTGSKDPDGNIIAYEWDFGDGETGSGARPVHIYKSPGVYQVRLTVTDDSDTARNTASDTASVEINGPPSVIIGDETFKVLETLKICPGENIQFDVSASSDPNGDPLKFAWDFGDGKSGTGERIPHVYDKPGRYVVSVIASDGRNMMCSETKASAVVIVNEVPMADAGADRFVNPNEKVKFDGSGSVDPDGRIITYMWNFGDGNTARGESVSHVYAEPGEYSVRLTVRDDADLLCNKASDTLVIKVNSPPVADAGADQVNLCTRTVQFDGTGSKDPDGTITSYGWDFGDGSPPGTGSEPVHTYTTAGTYIVKLRVADDSNLVSGIAEDTLKVIINATPTAEINVQNTACPGESVNMDAKGSYDSDGAITAYEWDFGDGSPKGMGRNIRHVYREPGNYKIILMVRDDSGVSCETGTVARNIRVNAPPVAVAGDDMITCIKTTDCSVTLDASQSYDKDGDHLTYLWNFGDGKTRKGIRVQHVYQKAGIYTVTLTVTDNSQTPCNTASDTLEIRVNAQPDARIK